MHTWSKKDYCRARLRVASSEILSRELDLNGSKIVPAENRLLIKLSNETQPMKLGK